MRSMLFMLLFHRTTRKVVLTDAGRILLARCRNIFDEVEGIQRDLDEASGAIAGVVRIGALEVFSIHLLPLALASLVKHNPAVVPHTYEMHPADMARHVVEGRLDVGFTIGASPRAGLDIAPLGTSPGVVVCGLALAAIIGSTLGHAEVRARGPRCWPHAHRLPPQGRW